MAARAPRAPGGSHGLKTVCLHGPESTGKTTLASQLAAHFATVSVPEFGRLYCEIFGNTCDVDDLRTIRRGHELMAAAGRRKADRLLILDTDAVMTAVWADILLGMRPADLDRIDDPADFYLLCDVDVPFQPDNIRYFPAAADRAALLALSRKELEKRHLPFTFVSGPREARFASAVAAIRRTFPELFCA